MVINAPAERIYAVLTDYKKGHKQILPEQYFSDLTVERGGIGAGTLIQFKTHVLGQSRTFRAEISEPKPGRLIEETDLNTGLVTTFSIEPMSSSPMTTVTITTKYWKSGIMGFIEQLTAPPLLRRIYSQELQKLEKYMRSDK